MFIYAKFRPDVACQKLLKSANVSQSYSKNKVGFTLRGPPCSSEKITKIGQYLPELYQLKQRGPIIMNHRVYVGGINTVEDWTQCAQTHTDT